MKYKSIFIGLTLYLLLAVASSSVNIASNSYKNYYYFGFPGHVVAKLVPTSFCPYPTCAEKPVKYSVALEFNNLPYLVYQILSNIITLALCIKSASYINKRYYIRGLTLLVFVVISGTLLMISQ